MERAAATPEIEKEKGKKWIMLIVLLLSLSVLIISLVFLAKIKGWTGRSEGTTLLYIVNAEQAAPEDQNQTLAFIDDEHMLDVRCVGELERLLSDCRGAGFDPVITAAFRSASEQRELLNERADAYMAQGYDAESAKALAQKEIALPGHSEHQLGLSVDIVQGDSTEEDQEGLQSWLSAHSWEYGFILRYPQGKESLTHQAFDPKHFRYVGADASKQIHELGVTLEEYVSMFYSNG